MAHRPYAGLQDILIKLATEWLKQRLEWYVRYDSRVQQLGGDVQNLLKVRDRVQSKVDEEETRYGKVIDVDVQNWLEGVDKIIPEYEKFEKDEDREDATCSICFLPRWGIRRRLSSSADGIAKQVAALLQKTPSHDQFSHWHGPPSMDAVLLNIDYVSFESRKKTMNDIMAALEDWSVRMIGVHGWSGVGKTTLVKEVAKKARDDKLFNMVIMANVTSNPDIIKIQGQIAEMLGMELEEKSDIARAARIRQRLKNEKQNTLIILDNLWAKLDFNLLGIPFANDEDDGKSLEAHSEKKAEKVPDASSEKKAQNLPHPHLKIPSSCNETKTKETLGSYKGCKVLLISETIQVLMSQMDGRKKSIFSVEVLKEKEAEMLFKTMAGIGDNNNSEFKKITAQIANKCEGLPMSIVTTARALKNQRRLVWEDVHRKLERQKLTGAPEFSTKLSYDLLESEELKFTFLLCARMSRDALIMDLVKYCIGLSILEGLYTVREATVRVLSLLAKLKESGLLSDSYSSDRFTMQDMVRRAALSISFEERHEFTMIKGKIDEWPDEDKLERYTVISLQHCDIIDDFPESINCPRLRVFHVDSDNPHLKILDNFFEAMKELRVLILSGIHLSPLPSSIRCLTKLRLLCLERCMLGEKLCLIGELKNLRILSFSGSHIIELPGELNQLTKLQIFDLSNCSKLAKIPFGVISSLISLEELYMRNTPVQWKVEGQPNQSENASLSELRHLNKLTILDIQIPNVSCLPNNLFFDKLYSYKIVIGVLHAYLETDFKMPEKHEASRFLGLQLKDDTGIHSQKGIKMLFERVENLLLEKLSDVKDIFYELNLKGFPYLKHLSIICNSDIQSLIKPKDRQHPEKAFPKLESLYLYDVKKMEEICSCTLSAPSFGKLKVIKIKLCGQLKNVFLISVVELLTVLETVEVSECNSLKEIVQSNSIEVKCLEFPKLRSLRLQSLSKFIGFYPISSSGETGELFHEKVVVSKLERMELSSIQINNIWSDKSSPSPNFQNLIHLDVIDCGNLKHLLSFSMAKLLPKLQSLFVSECGNMEHIFSQIQDSDTKTKDKVFPNLKNIKLTSMKSLSEIWNCELPFDSFGKLDTLIIEDCDKLVNVFPCYMVGIFQSLSNLRVTNCKKLKAIFDRNDKKQAVGELTNLQDVYLEALPKLEHVWKWNIDQQGILNMRNLQKVWIGDCGSLKYIFPVFIDNCLKNLEYLGVWNCSGLGKIVAKGEHNNINTNTTSPPLFEFPKLTTIKFSELPKLESFYSGARELSFPVLNDLSLELCDKLKPFTKESANAEKRPLFPEEVINNLKSMQIESWHAKSSSSYMGNYRRDNLEELQLSRLANTEILYSFLHSSPYLKSLSLNNCFFEELVSLERNHKIENLGVVPKLKSLKLIDLRNLENIGFERDMVLQRIEFFILESCPCLVTIVPSSVSFSHLTNLEVGNCKGLINLMPPSTAKSLSQLSTMKVVNCQSLKEIVSEQGIEQKDAGQIVFRQLEALELVSLENLKSFCSSKSCDFEFPLLEKLVVNACPKMENFSDGVSTMPILQKIYVVHEKEKTRWYWEGDLKATIQKMYKEKYFFEGKGELSFSDYQVLMQQASHGEVGLQNNWFYCLETLKLENCEIQPYAIPYNVLPYLKSLKELEVRDCNKVEGIFDMHEETTFQLKKLTLEGLSNLTNVWRKNRQGILSFQNLQEVVVRGCNNLRMLFPAAIAKNLKKLKELDIKECNELLEIVGKEEAAAVESTIEMFVFPCLTSLLLYWLPQLTCFYPERFTLECPELNYLYIADCAKLEVFQRQQEEANQGSNSNSISRQPLFSELKAICNLEVLSLQWRETSYLEVRFGQIREFPHLYNLWLFFDDDDVNEKSTLPLKFLEKAPNLESMMIYDCGSLEIFPTHCEGDDMMLRHLKTLILKKVSELECIGSEESSWLNTICDKLHKLYVYSCPRLTTFVNSAVSLTNLRYLKIQACHGLEYLFTSSTAKKFTNLEELHINACKSMEKIVKEEDETTSEGVKFEWLEKIILESLPSLECFYSGNATSHLPSLINVVIRECPKMKFFSQGPIHAESFRGIQAFTNTNTELVFHGDLNTTIKRQFLLQENIAVSDYHELEDMWHGLVLLPVWSFRNVKSLVVEGCEFLSNAILPSHLLPFLKKLEVLEVKNCNSVEAIFDIKDTHYTAMGPASPLHLRLKKLTLEKLPNLKHVWNEDPQGSSTNLPFLEEVFVEGCENLKFLFPASEARCILKTLDVRMCEGLVEIVAKDEGATNGANAELSLFPSLTSLTLWYLPKLKCFYPGMHSQEWPMLTVLDFYKCPMLKVFVTEFQNYPDSHPEGEDCLPINLQALISADKVTPHLEELSLNKEDVIMIEQGQVHVDLLKLKYLKLQFFKDELDVFPYVFLSKVPLPCIERLEVGDSTFKEIFPSERPDVNDTKILSQLKELELNYLPLLKSIGLEHSWIAPFTQRLKTLNVSSCECLTNLVPSSVTFSHLTQLIVDDCEGLKYLFTASTAKSVCLLTNMSVANCESLQEIVFEEAVESSSHDKGKIIFEQLNTLSLHSLPSLGRFYNGTCPLKLSSLEQLSLIKCSRMITFSEGTIIANKLSKVQFGEDADAVPLKVDLNSTIWNAFEAPEHLVLGDYHELDDMWLGVVPVPERSFSNLKSLTVEGCEFLSQAILPSHLFPFLRKLEELKVLKCNSIEAIFDVKDTKMGPDSPIHLGLKKMILIELPNLKHVCNEDPQVIMSLPFLEAVSVNGCKSIKSLFPMSVAKGILKTLDVKRCEVLVEIVGKDEGATEGAIDEELSLFPRLTSLTLWYLPKLKCFYPGMHSQEWPMLTVLDFYKCPMLKVFVTEFQNYPDSHPEGEDCLPINLQALISADKVTPHLEELSLNKEDVIMIEQGQVHVDLLKLKYLKLQFFKDELDVFPYVFLSKVPLPCIERLEVGDSTFKEIFPSERPDVNDTKILSQLKELELNYLPLLKSIGLEHSWIAPFTQRLKTLNVSSCECLTNLVPSSVTFSHLTQLIVDDCEGLKYLFTASTAKSVCLLTNMSVANCESLQEIVFEEAVESSSHDKGEIIFEQLNTLSLHSLPSLGRFYNGTCALKLPSLEQLSLIKCSRMITFSEGTIIANKLSKVQFGEDADAVPLKVDLNSTIWNAFEAPVPLPNVEKLELSDSNFNEIFHSQGSDKDDTKILSQLKGLELNYLPILKSMGLQHSWMASFPQILRNLNVRSCECLTNLVPSTVYFSHLTQLIVSNCDGLEYLLTSSTVKSLGVLEKMEIANCKSLKQIVAKEGNEADGNEIIFKHLNTLSLRSLTGVGKFYDGSCALSFPSLWQLSVIHCRRMVTFSEGTIIANKLSKVKLEENADAVPLEGGLNFTIWNAFETLEHLVLGDYHELDDVWLGVVPVPDRSFSNLKSLVVERCDFLSKAILPSHLLPFLRKLEELKVLKCDSIEAIFDVKDTKMGPASPLHLGLKKIILIELPNLKHVWNEDPQLIISFPFLEEVSVVGCKSIKSLFPASVAKGTLKSLDVKRCEGLVEIVAKDEGATEGAIEELNIFLSLTSLTLWNLPKLKCFYPGMHNQEWPMLIVLDVYKCPMLKVFVTEFQNGPDSHPEGEDCLPINQQALISVDKVTPHLEELSLNKEDVIMIEQGQVHVDLLKLKYLKLQFFNDESDVFPYVFLSKVPLPCIERLEVGDSTLKEIFPSEMPDVDDTKILSKLKGLELNYLPMLKSIGLEHFWIAPFTERLKTLNVKSCKCLTNLVSSTVSFSHLTELIVQYCDGLEYLFTSSTAKSLVALVKVKIKDCKSLKKIVEDEPAEEEPSLKNNVEDEQEKDEADEDEAKDDEPDEDEMIFGKLEILSLSSLPRLESFYTGSSTLKFPSLVKVSFTECDNMKMFCHGEVAVPKNLEGEIDGVHWSGVINTAINLS